ncbi:MAG: hypothetical protein Fur002_04240 [Anaerolineales bacterium]
MTRDKTLDVLKGLGCLLMIVAHSSLNLNGYDRFKFWGGLAPALFYAAAGAAAAFQAKKYQPRGVLLNYALLALIGFSFNRITDPDFLQEPEFDIIQIIAVGASAVYLLERRYKPKTWLYLALGFLAFALKFILQASFKNVSIVGVTNFLFPPGIFPIFPWLFLFFFGMFAYHADNRINLALALLFAALLFALTQLHISLDLENKWDMSLGYFLACNILIFAAFFLLRAAAPLIQSAPAGLLNFLGKNSLLFLYVHFPLILYLKEIRIHRTAPIIFQHPFLFWILALALTLPLMALLLRLVTLPILQRIFSYGQTWFAWVGLVFATGLLLPNPAAVYAVEIALGATAALFYPLMGKLFKRE